MSGGERLSGVLGERYTIERELGRGGMATVYLARDEKHDRRVALKVLDPELAAAVGAKRFLAEIKVTARLQHPHILPLHDSGERDGILYYVMPFAEGESLRDRLDRSGPLPIEEAVTIARQVASALDYAHRSDIVHRDVKPDNILLVDGEAVIADFGIALALDAAGSARLTEHGSSLGTPRYMSPEQATGEAVDRRADVYSLGAVLYEMLTGRPPHDDVTLQAFVAKLLTERPVRPGALRDTVGEALDEVVMKALAKLPADRYASADDFARALAEASTPRPVERRLGPATLALGVLATVAVGAAAYAALAGHGDDRAPVRSERQLTFEGTVQGASLSPDGAFFSYITLDGGRFRLYVGEVAGGTALPLDSAADLLCCVAWSPDGSRIAYQQGTRSRGSTVIVPRLGGAQRRVRAEVALAWSPEGDRLLSWWPAARELTVTDVVSGAGVGSIALGASHDWVVGATWSPDGAHVAVALQHQEEYRLRTLTLDGLVVEDVLRDEAPLTSPFWAHDGTGIYFLRGAAGLGGAASELVLVPVSPEGRRRGAPRTLLTGVEATTANATIPAFGVSSDGRRLVFNRLNAYSNLWRFSDWRGEGDEPAVREPLTSGTSVRAVARLSPDGTRLAYAETRQGNRNLFLRSVDGARARQLTFLEGGVRGPAWSPDGRTIAAAGIAASSAGLWLIDVETGTVERAPLEGVDGDEVAWAPRDDIVLQASDHTEILVVDPERWTSRAVVPAQSGAWWYDLRLGPDGRTLYARRTGSITGLARIDLESGTVAFLSQEVSAVVGVLPGGDLLTMSIEGRRSSGRGLFRLPPTGGTPSPHLTLPLGQGFNSLDATLSPDGRTLFAAVPVTTADVRLVEDFDPR